MNGNKVKDEVDLNFRLCFFLEHCVSRGRVDWTHEVEAITTWLERESKSLEQKEHSQSTVCNERLEVELATRAQVRLEGQGTSRILYRKLAS